MSLIAASKSRSNKSRSAMNVTGESEAACPSAQQPHSPISLGHCCPMQRLKWSFKNASYTLRGAMQMAWSVGLTVLWSKCQRTGWDGPSFHMVSTSPLKTACGESGLQRARTSLREKLLQAALEQNGLWLETDDPPSWHGGSSFSVSSTGWAGSSTSPAHQEAFKRPWTWLPALELILGMGSQLVNKHHLMENRHVLSGQSIQT